MPKLEDIDPTLDPIVIAAMLDDDEELVEDEKSSQPEAENNTENEDEQAEPETDEAETEETPDQPEEGNEVEESPSTEKEEAELEETEAVEDGTEKKLTRKEKREAKRQRYIDALKKEGKQNSDRNRPELYQADPEYKPIDYNQASEVDVNELVADRDKYGQQNFQRGAEVATRLAEMDNFWQGVEYEDKLLATDPKYAFLNENDPTNFDGDKAEELHELFFEIIGFDPESKTVRRTDLSWEKFVKNEVARIERWSKANEDEIIHNAVTQRATSGIRPSGSSSSSKLGTLQPGDISKMSQSYFDKHEAEIDRQILASLN